MLCELYTPTRRRELKNVWDYTKEDIDIDVCLETISRIPRWAGKLPKDWTVLDHSLLVAKMASEFNPDIDYIERYAVLHDFAESIIGDVITPIKKLLPEISKMEAHLLKTIYDSLDIEECKDSKVLEEIKRIDKLAAHFEEVYFFKSNSKEDALGLEFISAMESLLNNSKEMKKFMALNMIL